MEIAIFQVMGRVPQRLVLAIAVVTAVAAWPAAASAQRVCWPGVKVPPFEVPAVTIPAKEIPGQTISIPALPPGCVGDACWAIPAVPNVTIPSITVPAVTIPAFTIPAITIPERCFDDEKTDVPPPSETTVRIRHYERIDATFSLSLSVAYWRQTGTSTLVPNYRAEGFGESNAAGHVKNQYVRSYFRSDGTFVPGYWRYGKSYGRATCTVIRCG
jgi:hypothetical protein